MHRCPAWNAPYPSVHNDKHCAVVYIPPEQEKTEPNLEMITLSSTFIFKTSLSSREEMLESGNLFSGSWISASLLKSILNNT